MRPACQPCPLVLLLLLWLGGYAGPPLLLLLLRLVWRLGELRRMCGLGLTAAMRRLARLLQAVRLPILQPLLRLGLVLGSLLLLLLLRLLLGFLLGWGLLLLPPLLLRPAPPWHGGAAWRVLPGQPVSQLGQDLIALRQHLHHIQVACRQAGRQGQGRAGGAQRNGQGHGPQG
jgi:hypothetical protein